MPYKDSLRLPATVKKQAKDLLSKGDTHQNLRKEIMFGLLPTTAAGEGLNLKFLTFLVFYS